MKICYKCKKEKTLSEFSVKRRNKDGLQHECRECKGIHQRKWYAQNSTSHKKEVSINRKRYKQEMRNLKDNKPCVDCGVVYPYFVLDWDHLPGQTKLYDVSRLSSSSMSRKYREEIAKCDLVCSNCHRYRTHKRRIQAPQAL